MLRNIKVFESVSVEDELPDKKSICFRNDKKLLWEWIDKKDIEDLKITNWLKEKELYCAFETKEEFEKYLYKLLGAEYIKELH